MDTRTTGVSPFRGQDSFPLDVGHGSNRVRIHLVAVTREPGASESGHLTTVTERPAGLFHFEGNGKSDYDLTVRNAVVPPAESLATDST
jgi:hypothetical protein